jgi:WD40 repeat protein
MEFTDFFGDVWSFDINSEGTGIISASADQSIRIYELSSEQTFPEIEKEKIMDKNIEEELEKDVNMNSTANVLNKDIDKLVPIKKSLDNIGYAEDLMDSLDITEKFKRDVYDYEISLDEYKVTFILYLEKP